jgi:serpin B
MMHKVDQTPQFTLVAADGVEDGRGYVFPYAGLDLALVVLEPDASVGLATMEAHLASYDLATLIDQADPLLHDPKAGAQVSLPKFQIASSLSLAGTLQALGVHSAFDAGSADFSGIDGSRDLWLDQVIHQATIKVDEAGTTASGATVETLTAVDTGGEPEPVEITIDHSFTYLLYDRVTRNVLFAGRVIDPTVQ